MRSDMAKVIVERPRFGSSRRGYGKGYQRKQQRIPAEDSPKYERLKQAGYASKNLNEHLGPLRRYLRSQVGRPWDKVFSEICANLSRDSAVQDHVRDHVMDYVATNVFDIDGVLHFTNSWGKLQPLADFWRYPIFYVCPNTGLLKLRKTISRRQYRHQHQEKQDLPIFVEYLTGFVRQDGRWRWVRFEPFRKEKRDHLGFPLPVPDVLQQCSISRADAVQLYGQALFAKEVRPATREEIRKYCEPLKAPNRVV